MNFFMISNLLPNIGLVNIARSFAIDLLAPRKKITVLLIGNHSAGKSSFINWYIEEHILKTGVAIETQGFTFVTSGRKRESLQGNASLHLNPYFKPLQEIPGTTEWCLKELIFLDPHSTIIVPIIEE